MIDPMIIANAKFVAGCSIFAAAIAASVVCKSVMIKNVSEIKTEIMFFLFFVIVAMLSMGSVFIMEFLNG